MKAERRGRTKSTTPHQMPAIFKWWEARAQAQEGSRGKLPREAGRQDAGVLANALGWALQGLQARESYVDMGSGGGRDLGYRRGWAVLLLKAQAGLYNLTGKGYYSPPASFFSSSPKGKQCHQSN